MSAMVVPSFLYSFIRMKRNSIIGTNMVQNTAAQNTWFDSGLASSAAIKDHTYRPSSSIIAIIAAICFIFFMFHLLSVNNIMSFRTIGYQSDLYSDFFLYKFNVFSAVFRKILIFPDSTDITFPSRKVL